MTMLKTQRALLLSAVAGLSFWGLAALAGPCATDTIKCDGKDRAPHQGGGSSSGGSSGEGSSSGDNPNAGGGNGSEGDPDSDPGNSGEHNHGQGNGNSD